MHIQIKAVENNKLVVNTKSKKQLLFTDVVQLERAFAAWIASSKNEISIMDTLTNGLNAYISVSVTYKYIT